MLRWVVFDWGDTLMFETGPDDRPMAAWPEVHALDGAHALLTALASRYGIAIATNASVSTRDDIRAALARVALDEPVRELFCFRDLGVKKRDPAFWDAVVARLGVARDELVMVGDDLAEDVLAPRKSGIASVWLNWKGATTPTSLAAPVIMTLAELPAILDDWQADWTP